VACLLLGELGDGSPFWIFRTIWDASPPLREMIFWKKIIGEYTILGVQNISYSFFKLFLRKTSFEKS